MDEYIAWLWEASPWHWFGVGGLLFALEILLPTTILIFPGLAALVVGALVIVAPDLDWRLQLLVFAVLSLAASVGWRIWFRRRDQPRDHPLLNNRSGRLIGRRLVLEDGLRDGRWHVKIDQVLWLARSHDGARLAAGETVEVTAVDDGLLCLRPVTPTHPPSPR